VASSLSTALCRDFTEESHLTFRRHPVPIIYRDCNRYSVLPQLMLSLLATYSMCRRPSISCVLLTDAYGKSSSISACNSFGNVHGSCANGSNGWNTSAASSRSSPSPAPSAVVAVSSAGGLFDEDLGAVRGFQPRKDVPLSAPAVPPPLMSSSRVLKSGSPSSMEEVEGCLR